MNAALKRHREFLEHIGVASTAICPMCHSEPAPAYTGPICPFPFEFDPTAFPVEAGGPFEAPNFSFFVPKDLLQKAVGWWQQRRRYSDGDQLGELDVIVHTNTGCQMNDHTTWSLWMGTTWEMNLKGLACCLNGPAGCRCKDTYYVGAASEGNGTCLAVHAESGGVYYKACDLDAFDPYLMWHEVTYRGGHAEIDSLGWSFGKFSAVDSCLGVDACETNASVRMTICGRGDALRTRVSFLGKGTGVRGEAGLLSVDSCPGFCAVQGDQGKVVLGSCAKAAARMERRCVMAPGLAPTACPGDNAQLLV